jgi:hypothetical protein
MSTRPEYVACGTCGRKIEPTELRRRPNFIPPTARGQRGMPNITPSSIDAPDRRRLAVEAEVHPETVRRYLSGLPVRPLSRRRIIRAAAALGLSLPTSKSSAA